MVEYANSADFGGKLCQALGLDPNRTRKITISLESGDIVRISTIQFMNNDQAQCVYELLLNYSLAALPEPGDEDGNL